MSAGYHAGRWPAEDGGPTRPQACAGAFAGWSPSTASVSSREVAGATMVVWRDPDELYLLGHTAGDDAVAWVERLDPLTLAPRARSVELLGGPAWPGGIAAHADGGLHVVFGRHAHRLRPDLSVAASAELPRERAYNSFVVLPDGHLVTKDFGGLRPGESAIEPAPPAQLCVLDPVSLEIVARAEVPEPSIARLSADGALVYVVGDTSLFRLAWDGIDLALDEGFAPRYRTLAGQTHGWDAVLSMGAAWFLDDGAGSERYAGTFRGQGVSTSPLHLVRVGLVDGSVSLTEVSGLSGGLVANPPLIDPVRRLAVAYDSGNGVMAAFDIGADGETTPRWRVDQDHGSHLLLDPDRGLVLTADHDGERWMEQLVVREIETGVEQARLDSGSALQSVLFPAPGDRCVYLCSFSTVSRLAW
ncbi:hypothetical protein [Rhabdothermincola salaria]|uniref:hypothetical protein n=1 Tax=Rhabdothermincola salaria TaxID=2903142 RepID=UPI001E583049|nr:hypothetical protein [Rhabdothermincola salaria]MCD9622434.1 hypothetical protein [Rhabdothermincola salaria]